MSELVAVASRSFSKHPILRRELLVRHPNARFNDAGASLKGEELVAFLGGCDKSILGLERVDDALLSRLPRLKLISKFGVGLDSLDLDALARRGVKLSWTPGTNSQSVAELALMMALALLRRVPEARADMKEGRWGQLKGTLLSGKTVGLIGFGAVAREFARLLAPFGAVLLAHDPFPDAAAAKRLGADMVGLDELISRADVVSLHVPLIDSTRGLFDAQRLSAMKPSAVLINTARGGLVDEAALLAALDEGRLAGAGLDCFAAEPPADRRILSHPKIFALPHVGGSTEEAILAMGRAAISGLDGGLDAASFRR